MYTNMKNKSHLYFSIFVLIFLFVFSQGVLSKYSMHNYIDNSLCLLKDNPKNCELPVLTTGTQDLILHFGVGWDRNQKSGGHIRFFWDSSTELSKLMNKIDYVQWKPVQDASGNMHDRYLMKIYENDPNGDEAGITGQIWYTNSDGSSITGPFDCDKSLRIGSNYYNQDTQSAKGLWCWVPRGLFAYQVKLKFPTLKVQLKVNSDQATDRMIKIPVMKVNLYVDGYSTTTNGDVSGPWGEHVIPAFAQISNPAYIRLNDRQCALKIKPDDTSVNFGSIKSTPPGKTKLREVEMPFKVTCSGYVDNEIEGSDQYRKGLGISNELIALKINSTSGTHSSNSEKTIGLSTDSKQRDDLYVEGSFHKDQNCNVNSLFTNNSQNRFDPSIMLMGKRESEDYQSKLYWRLCTPYPTESLKTGDFKGSAILSVDYN